VSAGNDEKQAPSEIIFIDLFLALFKQSNSLSGNAKYAKANAIFAHA
jgi:hypothetical protein